MSIRDYYLKYRQGLSFQRMNQAVLYEHIPGNISKSFSVGLRQYLHHPAYEKAAVGQIYYRRRLGDQGLKRWIYLTTSGYFNFITCHGFEQRASPKYFLLPFLDTWIWVLLVLSFILTSLLLWTSSNSQNFSSLKFYFYTISVLLENGFQKIQSHVKEIYRIIFLILAIISLIVGNYYKAVFTMDITSPIPARIPVESFDEIRNWSIAILPSPDILNPTDDYSNKILRKLVTLNSVRFKNRGIKLHSPLQYHFDIFYTSIFLYELRPDLIKFAKSTGARLLMQISGNALLFPSFSSALNHISKCDKTAFVGTEQELIQFRELSTKNSVIKLGTGKDRSVSTMYLWEIPMRAGEFLHRRMANVLSSGIYFLWERVFYSKTRDQVDPLLKTTVKQKQKLFSNLGQFFYIFLTCILIGVGVFMFEIIISYTYQVCRVYSIPTIRPTHRFRLAMRRWR